MTNLEQVKQMLENTNASLVVLKDGEIKCYDQHGIKDLINILKKDDSALKEAIIADKIIGKVAASIIVVAGVKEVYTKKISKLAIPIFRKYHISYEYEEQIEFIQNRDQSGMCPMETKFKDETDVAKIYKEFI